jgi:hypothetical protein
MERYHKLTTTPLVIFQLQEILSRFVLANKWMVTRGERMKEE